MLMVLIGIFALVIKGAIIRLIIGERGKVMHFGECISCKLPKEEHSEHTLEPKGRD